MTAEEIINKYFPSPIYGEHGEIINDTCLLAMQEYADQENDLLKTKFDQLGLDYSDLQNRNIKLVEETESIRKELQEAKDKHALELMEMTRQRNKLIKQTQEHSAQLGAAINAVDDHWKAKAAKLVEALEDIRAVEFNGECGSIAYRALSQYESNGEGEGNG